MILRYIKPAANLFLMKKKHVSLFLAVLVAAQVSAQVTTIKRIHEPVVRCYAEKADPSFEAWLQQKTEERKSERLTVQSYVMPIIFHILYDGEAEGDGSNVSQALMQQQILQLNKDYANLSNSPYAVASNTGIQFVLAQKSPSGTILAEPGIDRLNRSSKGFKDLGTKGWSRDYITDTIKPQTIWNPEKYINVWLVPQMNNGSSTGKLLGFSTFPVSSTLSGLNNEETSQTTGCVIDYSTVGSLFRPQICDPGTGWGKGKTLTHELGHFFGLRHIWGDDKCATDYVDDTPTQEDANSGTPIHPKPDACGTPDEMFENYMDYSDDDVLNTFTSKQVDRMQIVMLNSPRRKNLPLSDVGFVAVTGSNKIAFTTCTGDITTTETGTNGTYPRYKDISLTLNTEYAASAAATVTVKVTGSASSTQYQIMTPTLTFAKGDTYKPVVIRLIDNAAVDGDRELDVSYIINGTGVVADTGSQTVTINETDDDDIIFAGNDIITILDEKFETGSGDLSIPTGWSSLISDSYPNVFVASTNGNAGGSGKAAYITNNKSTKPNSYTKGINGAAELLSPEINPLQYKSIDTLRFKYRVKGSVDDHAYVVYDIGENQLPLWGPQGLTGSGPYYGTGSVQSASLVLPAPSGVINKRFQIGFYWETGTGTTGGDPGFNVDDVSLTAEPYHIETDVSSSFGYDVQLGSNNKFRSGNNKVVAAITSASAKIAGVSAAVSQSGTGKGSILADGNSINRTQKVITLLPAGGDSSASYNATFYFTAAEMATWGNKAGTLSILKVKNGVDLSGSLSSAEASFIAPTSVDNRLSTEGFITYTAKLNGFGQYMLTDNAAATPSNDTAQWVSIYPNPVNNKLTLNFTSTASQSVTIILSDMSGRVLYKTQTTVAGQKEINMSSLSKAVYIMKVQTSKQSKSFKILKE